jgi:predicted patatin/cPLA2 family phospholipase
MNYPKGLLFAVIQLMVLTLLLQGCSIPGRLAAVPKEETAQAQIPGLSGVRYLANGDMTQFMVDLKAGISSELAYRAKTGQQGPLPPANYLAISGGGDDGAYGAGLLCGWTKAGNRPEFKLVTGISTGALIAPFAFLGPKYDDKLREVYTNSTHKDIMEERGLHAVVFDDALADNRPLWELLQKHISAEMLREVAQEYKKGRILLVGTTDLDSRRAVIWNLTKIAGSGHPQALDLFRKLMMASAAIPGAFPPAMIDVEVNGKPYQEMHVDGGTVAQVFVYPPSIKLKEAAQQMGVERERNLYLIRNSRIDPDWSEVERRSLSILGKAVLSLIRTQGIGDMYRIYLNSQRDGIDFNLAFIPASFNELHVEDFDKNYMQKLFLNGYNASAKGYPWAKVPPGY